MLAVFGGLAVLELVSCAQSANGWLAFRSATLFLAGAAVFLVARSGDGAGVVVALGVVAGSALLEALGPLTGLSQPGHVLGERSLAAEVLLIGAPLLATLAVRDRRAGAWVVGCVAAAVCVLTRTRGVWLTAIPLVAFGLVLAGRTPELRKRAGVFALAVAVSVAVAPWLSRSLAWSSVHPYRDTLVQLVDADSASGAGRLVQYDTTARMWLAHPMFGVGPGNWAGQCLSFARAGDPTVNTGYWPTNRVPNSDLLGTLAERGALSFLVLAALAVMVWRTRGENVWLRRGTMMVLCALGALDAVMQLPAPMLLGAWVLGSTTRSDAGPMLRRSAWVWAVMAIVLVAGAGFAVRRSKAAASLASSLTVSSPNSRF